MPDRLLARNAPDPAHDIMRRHAGGLIDN